MFSVNPLKLKAAYQALPNSDFENFQTTYGRGGVFLVISGPENLDFGESYEYSA